ncbi:MAG TPA: tRNA 2-selenouridine(34) synthase MnmH [Chitinophagaceae bacterium]|nr:tRNA 2-selenouridine(34) synthase MnmH [Chitinophagaceae bacterium]
MAIEKINIEQFLQFAQLYPVLDVRSPAEYDHAHIPGAYSFPLFSDEERKVVGTTYKQQSREAAIKVGLEFFGPKMRKMIEETEAIVNSRKASNGTSIVLVHCWRGGMRSAGVAWLLDLYGFKVYTLVGGYKFFRRWVLGQFDCDWHFIILGGYTGSGKTELLKQLAFHGEHVIDLESIANHKGSAFGNIGLPPQPTQEMFENALAVQMHSIKVGKQILKRDTNLEDASQYPGRPIWLEDESQRIGTVNIPQALWLQMRKARIYFVDIPFEERLEHIVEEYGQLDKERMVSAIERIQKRLGGLETKTSIQLLKEGKMKDAFRILLKYYDKWYLKGLQSRSSADDLCRSIKLNQVDALQNAIQLMKEKDTNTLLKTSTNEPGYR